VSTAREGAADLIGPNRGTIVTPENDPAALAGVLRSYIGDDDRRRREGETSRRWAEARFAAPVVGRRVEAVLRTACSRAR
jgi:glycosyltransferase involved in cell wall biosynthesis